MRFLKKNNSGNPHEFVTGAGSRKKKVFGPRFDGKRLTLVETGEVDIQDQINSHRTECDMNFILTRLGAGDYSVLNQSEPFFADFHDLPSNFREVFDIALNSEQMFGRLPLDVRKKFDNDYRKWLYTAGSDEWNSIMKPEIKPVGDSNE